MYVWVAPLNRDEQLHIRVRPDIKEDLKILAELRGLTMSGFVHSLIVRSIREEKLQFPESFGKSVRNVNKIKSTTIKLKKPDEKRETG